MYHFKPKEIVYQTLTVDCVLCFRSRQSSHTATHSLTSFHSTNSNGSSADAMDLEVALANGQSVMSREPSLGSSSYSDMQSRGVTETPSDDFSDEDYDRSSPIEMS